MLIITIIAVAFIVLFRIGRAFDTGDQEKTDYGEDTSFRPHGMKVSGQSCC